MKKITLKGHGQQFWKVFRWFGFSVLIALVPIGFSWLFDRVTKSAFSLEQSLSHGELLLISIAIVGEACGQLFSDNKITSNFKTTIGLGCLIVLLASCSLFGIVTAFKGSLDTIFIMNFSILIFVVSLFAGCCCKWTEK